MLPHPIIPPAWSLAAEFHFYLLLPFIFMLQRKGFIAVLGVSAVIQICALFFESGDFNSNNFGYRFIFGALTFFLFGYSYARSHERFFKILTRLTWAVYAVMLVVIAPMYQLFSHSLVTELLLGTVLALPLISAALKSKPQDLWLKATDSLLGRLAYPIFISHFFSFYLCEKLFSLTSTQQILYIPAVTLLCLCISYTLMRMQDFIENYRLSRRGFSSMAKGVV